MFDQLSSLNTSRTNWRVKVRVTRMWSSGSNASNGKDGIIKGYNLILLDDDNCHVHAYVYGDNWKKLSEPIVEGGLYILSNFFTREALGSLKPVSSKIIINFSPATSVELVPEDDFMIPFHKFEFVDLSELFSLASSYANPKTPDYSTDVIGAVEDFEKLSIIGTMFGDRKIVKFCLTDGSCIGCGEEAYTVEGKFKCTTKCQGSYPVSEKRYRIVILAEDSTEGYNFVLLDRAAKRLLGKTATKLIAENSKLTSTEFPKNIRDITGKDITLKIQLIRSDNILMNSRLYYASDAFENGQTSFSIGDATTSTASAMGDEK
ncbi:hypothetical protein ACET3Z_028630 [Daucus carota]